MDVWAKAIERGKVTAEEIAGSIANVASTAAAMNIPIQEVGATYATLTARGVPAAEATTRLNAALISLQRIPPGMNELQEATGKSYETIARTEGVQAAMQELVTDADKYKVSLIDVFGRQEAMAFALNVTGAAGKQFSADLKSMYESTGTAAAQAEERMGTFNRSLDILGASIGSALISIGTAFLPMLTGLAQGASAAAQSFTAWSNANPGLAANILLVVGAVGALVAGLTIAVPIIGAVGAGIGLLTSPITLVIAAVVAFSVAWATNWNGIRDVLAPVETAIRAILGAIGALAGMMSGVLTTAFTGLKGVMDGITSAINAATGAIGGLIAGAKQAVDAVAAIPGVKLGGDIAGNVGGAAGGLGGAFDEWIDTLAKGLPKFAAGGVVPGSGPQLAVVHGGETVTPAGQGGQATHLTLSTNVQIDERTIVQIIEEHLFRNASNASSGFMAGNPVSGA